MKTLNFPRRAMRPHAQKADMPANCSWCKKPIPQGVVFTCGKDLGKDAIVCNACLTPPAIGEHPSELTVED